MESYQAPQDDMLYGIDVWLQAPAGWAHMPTLHDVDTDLAGQVLKEAARFSSAVITPLNLCANRQRYRCTPGEGQTEPIHYHPAMRNALLNLGAHSEGMRMLAKPICLANPNYSLTGIPR